ncbi:hypothetical protein [Roseixanthobacter liquoris]|uniref:hypothetical protein n=1 Tax=Roseixanthobacter liquoris TaxID=3119921 RepID=UPI00372CAB88
MGAAVVPGGEAAPVIELGKQGLDLVPLAFEVLSCKDRLRLRDEGIARRSTLGAKRVSKPSAVIAPVDNQVSGRRQGVEDQTGALVITHLAFRQELDYRPILTLPLVVNPA